jgi:YfiH family protein
MHMQHHDIPVLEVDLGPGIRAFFTTRHGGVSGEPWLSLNLGAAVGDEPDAVRANRRQVDALVTAPVSYARQVHGRNVVVLTERAESTDDLLADETALGEADGLVTAARALPVGVYVADCVPVLLADPASGVVAAVHAGRPGIEVGVIAAALAAMTERGAKVERVRAAIGPAVCGDCYEVPEQLRERVGARVPEAVATTAWGTPALDLPRAARAQLVSLGVKHVEGVDRCTRTDPAFFSHRQASAAGLVTGRTAGIVERL